MWLVCGVLTILFIMFGIMGIIGMMDPESLNKNLKEGTKPWTKKSSKTLFIVSLSLTVIFGTSTIIGFMATSKPGPSKTSSETAKAEQKKAAVKKLAAQKKKESSKTKHPAVHLVSDQYLQSFLTFMDAFHSDLSEEMNNPSASQTEVATLLTSNNAEGWKQYDYINSAEINPLNASQTQPDNRIDVLHAWQSLFQLDMDYNDYVMNDTNITSTTLNSDEQVYLSDFNKANSDFAKK